jgi:hypothetical protein
MEKFMNIEAINLKFIWGWIGNVWAKSLAAFVMFFIGLYIGQVQTESRVIGDCKYAGAFRVEQQAFMCQRRI